MPNTWLYSHKWKYGVSDSLFKCQILGFIPNRGEWLEHRVMFKCQILGFIQRCYSREIRFRKSLNAKYLALFTLKK